MATLTLRNVKGSALTHAELDSNFGALDSDITAINTTIAGGVGLGADSVNSLIDARIDSDTFVNLTGDQTIAGIKTFSDSAVFSGPLFGDGSNLTGIESYDSVKVQGQIDSDFPTRELNELINVNVPTPVGGDVLVYDSSTSKWVTGSANARQEFHFTPNAGTTAITGNDKFGSFLQYIADSDQLDVFVNGILLVDSDYTKTNNGTITLDVATTASDEVVIHKYRKFVVAGDEISDLNLNDLVNVTVANPQDQQVLIWDSSQQTWVAANTNVRSQFHYTPAPGTTAITGNDKFGNALLYATDDTLDVFINGALLNDSDYTRTSLTTITLDVATDSNDDVRIIRVEPTRVGETQTEVDFLGKTTDDLTQGSTNLYFTNAAARGAISVTGDLSYNSTTGVISYTDGGSINADSVNALIDARIDSDDFVALAGNQTVAGIKTFSDSAVFSSPVSIQGVTYPDSAGRSGQLLVTQGDGSTTFDSVQAGAINDVFWENSQLLSISHTVAAGRSALSAGPITIDTGVTTTIDSTARWVIL